MLTFLSFSVQAAPPDLTAGGVPGDTISFNMGPIGTRGWVYHQRENTSQSRQIQIRSVTSGTPAAGILEANDVILGADGTGAEPVNFTSDARQSLGLAIGDAEARDPATLKLIRWRDGATSTVTITLQHMGAYSATAPYNCPKSSLILERGLQAIMGGESAGSYSFGTLSLLAANNPEDPANAARMTRARNEAHALIPTAAEMQRMMSDQRDATSMITWQRGHTLIVLAEYFLLTGDEEVLPAVEAYAVNIARNSSLFGTMGHIFATKNPDGSDNGPMGGVYGPVNNAGMPCYIGLILARESGIDHPSITPAIERMNLFYGYYVGKGTVPYGEHDAAWDGHENNGKSGMAAVAYTLQDDQVGRGRYNAKMATAAATERGEGHTGAFFNYVWAPLGAACGGEQAAASHFSRIRWMLDLNRRWDDRFDYDCLTGEGPNSGSQYNNFRMSTAALLTYALPLRQLRITGKNHDPARWLSPADVAEAAAVDGYNAAPRSTSELIADLGSWSPCVQRRAIVQLATRTMSNTLVNQLTTLSASSDNSLRAAACLALGRVNHSDTANSRATTLAARLTDPDNHVRFMAAEGMRYLPNSARLSQLDAILTAAASTAKPLFPFDEEDPLHFAHSRLAVLLFYSGNAYGPRGVIWGSGINGVDRNLLYPAIRAVAANPVGFARSCLTQTYRNLTAADVDALAGSIVESVRFGAPSDKMFNGGVRQGGLDALEKFKKAEGVPLSMIYMVDDTRNDAYTYGLNVLKKYGGGGKTVTPDPKVVEFCQALLGTTHAATAQEIIDILAASTNPPPLTPFKSIQSVSADAPSLNLPSTQTTLRVNATDLAEGDLVFTWRKIHGAGNVTFTPNGTAAARDTAIQYDAVPGNYLFEVTVSDSRGLTEVYGTVATTLRNPDGSLPANNPPTANPQAVSASSGMVTPITLTGSDPEGYALVFSVTSQPNHGVVTGTAPEVAYTSDGGFIGIDSFTFQVMDSEGQTHSATITINVSGAGIILHAYEGFDYDIGSLTGLNGGSGFAGGWLNSNGTNESGYVWGPNPGVTFDGTTLSWDGILNNNFPTSPKSTVRYLGASAIVSSNLNIYRQLATNAAALADDDGVLWMSAVFHLPNRNFAPGPHIGLASGWMRDRGRQFQTTTTDFIGVASYTGTSNIWDAGNLVPAIVDSNTGANAWQNFARTVGPALPISSQNIILVMKFTFGESAAVEALAFHDNMPLGSITESAFNAGKTTTTYTNGIDASNLNYLVINQGRFDNALDEIRIGNSFAAVSGVEGPPADTDPPILVSITDNRAGEPVPQFTPVTYTVTFSEMMDSATVTSASFNNAGTAEATIGTVMQILPGVFSVQVTPTTTGTLQLRIPAGALLTDLAGNPLDTTAALADDTVLTVAILMVDVPFVIGMSESAAESEITGAGLAVGTVDYQHNANVDAGEVIGQNPGGGTSMPYGSSVDLVVSLGPLAMVTVPDVVGLAQAAAESAILSADLTVGAVSTQSSDTVPAGDVISQNPDGGTSAGLGSAVDLVVSLGDITPPSPDPMTFAVAPHATGDTTIAMTATTASDANSVEYLFTNTTLGTDSGWQDSPVFENTGLQPGTPYTYTVTARDKSANLNATAPSEPAVASTLMESDGTWAVNAGGNWSEATNWLDGIVARGPGKTAVFTMTGTGDRMITVDSAQTIGNLTRTWPVDNILTIGGTSALTLEVADGLPTITNNDPGGARRIEITAPLSGTQGLAIAGGMVLIHNSATNYSGPTTVSGGGFLDFGALDNANIGGGIAAGRNITVNPGGTVRFNNLSNALLNRIVEATGEITVMTGSTGNALDFSSSTGASLPDAFLGNWAGDGGNTDITGSITPAAGHYRFGSPDCSGLLTIASNLGGTQGLLIGGNHVQLSGTNTHTGATFVRNGARLVLARATAMQNSPLDTGTAADTGMLTLSDGTGGGGAAGTNAEATPNPILGGLTGSRDLSAMIHQGSATATDNGNAGDNTGTLALNAITGITLNPGEGREFTYLGAIANLTGSTTALYLTKTGQGSQTLTGHNTYTGETLVNEGTLALVGGSQASDITVAAGASLGFTLGSPTTSSAHANLTHGTIKITGTVDNASDHLLITATGGITGPPVLDAAIPGYELQLRNDDKELWLARIVIPGGYETWATGNEPFAGDANGDGVANGLAFLLGAANPEVDARPRLPLADENADALILSFSMLNADKRGSAALAVQWSKDLGMTDPWAANMAVVPDTSSEVNGVGFVITPNGDLINVEATIPATASAAGRLFGRLYATEN